jgi:hypothetical protein
MAINGFFGGFRLVDWSSLIKAIRIRPIDSGEASPVFPMRVDGHRPYGPPTLAKVILVGDTEDVFFPNPLSLAYIGSCGQGELE